MRNITVVAEEVLRGHNASHILQQLSQNVTVLGGCKYSFWEKVCRTANLKKMKNVWNEEHFRNLCGCNFKGRHNNNEDFKLDHNCVQDEFNQTQQGT